MLAVGTLLILKPATATPDLMYYDFCRVTCPIDRPRTVEIRRLRSAAVQNGVQQVGLLEYRGAVQSDGPEIINGEEALLKNVSCDIQAHHRAAPKTGLCQPMRLTNRLSLIICQRDQASQRAVSVIGTSSTMTSNTDTLSRKLGGRHLTTR
jgi:hypothetical protein